INEVLAHNPSFWEGYQMRASLRRKLGDRAGAERDEFKVLKERMDIRAGIKKASVGKTRKKSDHNINDYDKLVEADSNEPQNEYTSEWRGKVQNKYVDLKPLPALSEDLVREAATDQREAFMEFNKGCAHINAGDNEKAINAFSAAIRSDVTMAEAYYNRGVANLLAGNKTEGLSDLSHAGELGLYGAYNLIKRYSK
ncbi:MAG: tetratricopeptide repeat protein, partial [Bacteroidaceae bacterium]|nr:tetratricopeptide repeat protein [Bacteroidaceae bacterium]